MNSDTKTLGGAEGTEANVIEGIDEPAGVLGGAVETGRDGIDIFAWGLRGVLFDAGPCENAEEIIEKMEFMGELFVDSGIDFFEDVFELDGSPPFPFVEEPRGENEDGEDGKGPGPACGGVGRGVEKEIKNAFEKLIGGIDGDGGDAVKPGCNGVEKFGLGGIVEGNDSGEPGALNNFEDIGEPFADGEGIRGVETAGGGVELDPSAVGDKYFDPGMSIFLTDDIVTADVVEITSVKAGDNSGIQSHRSAEHDHGGGEVFAITTGFLVIEEKISGGIKTGIGKLERKVVGVVLLEIAINLFGNGTDLAFGRLLPDGDDISDDFVGEIHDLR